MSLFIYRLFQASSPTLSNGTPHRPAPDLPPKPKSKFSPLPTNGAYPQISPLNGGVTWPDESNDHDYELLSPSARIKPSRPAPRPPSYSNKTAPLNPGPAYGTLTGFNDLDGVPFALNPRLSMHESQPVHVSLNITHLI